MKQNQRLLRAIFLILEEEIEFLFKAKAWKALEDLDSKLIKLREKLHIG